MAKNYYDILGIEKNASADDIKSAYRRLAKKYHPDVNKTPEAAEKFKEVSEAYGVLSDPTKKGNYDQYGSAEGPNPSDFFRGANGGFHSGSFDFGGFEDLFNIFGGGFGGGAKKASMAQRGQDIRIQMTLSFEEAVFGCKKEVTIPKIESCELCNGTGAKNGTKYTTCKECNGSGYVKYTEDTLFGRVVKTGVCKACNGTGRKILEKCDECNGDGYNKVNKAVTLNIPAGIDNGQVMTLRGEGNAGLRGGQNGDLQVVFKVKPHKLLVRDGFDLYLKVHVPFYTLLLGGEIEIPLPSGTTALKIPELTQSNTVFKLKNKGIKHLNKDSYGTLIVQVIAESPKKLSKDEKKKLTEISDSLGNSDFAKYNSYLKDMK